MSTLNEFTALCQFGRLLPLVNGEKHPDGRLAPNGFHSATSDTSIVAAWHAEGVNGFGLLVDHLILDFDDPASQAGFAALCRTYGFNLATWAAQTPRGMHLHFSIPYGWSASTRAGASLSPDCEADIRGLGKAYVVAPPTELSEGRCYRWAEGAAPWDCPLQEAPGWLLSLIEGRPARIATAQATDGGTDDPEIIERLKQRFLARAIQRSVQGSRNRELCQLAAQLRDMRLPLEEAQDLAVGAWWSQIDNAGFSRRQVLATVRGIYKRPPRAFPRGFYQQAASAPESEFNSILDSGWSDEPNFDPTPELRVIDPMQVRQTDLPAREELIESIGDGVLGQLHRVMVSTAPRQQPWISIGAALCTLGVVMGRRYCFGHHKTRSNIYAIATAPTGAGKEHARTVAKAVLDAAGLPNLLGDQRLRSGSRIVGTLLNSARQLCLVDEFGLFVKSISGRGVPFYRTEIRDTLMSLFSCSGSSYNTPDPGGSDTRTEGLVIQQPCLCLYATTTGQEMWAGLTNSDSVNGFLNRFLLFSSHNHLPPRNKPPRGEEFDLAPKRLVDGIRALNMGHGLGNLEMHTDATHRETGGVVLFQPYRIEADWEGEQVLEQFAARIDALRENALQQGNSNLAAILARVEEHAAKVALIRAAGDNLVDPVVTGEIARWSVALAETCAWDMAEEVELHVADNEAEAENKRMLRIILDAGPEGISSSELSRLSKWARTRQRKELLDGLIESGEVVQIEAKQVSGPGRPRKTFVASVHFQQHSTVPKN